jgi:tetratricopeptide (TPR) repeat protein
MEQFDLDSTLFPAMALMIEAQQALLQGEHQEAIEKFEGALEKDPQSGPAYAGLAQAEQVLGKSDEAWRHKQIAIFIDGSNSEILFAASTLADEQGREDESQRYLQQAFDQMEDQTFSSSYYYRSYYRFFLSSDLMPQIMHPNFPNIVIDG